ncbi:MAG: type I DNA topoisomerase [Clostridia bacterium]|nr:type I DNA topoisomerase [Clostridia bacterium]
MADNLIIIESPGKVKTISKILGSKYKVVASAGHLRDLPASKLAIDVENDFKPEYINIRGKGDVIKELKAASKAAKKVFLATDPDREGEAISWHLSYLLGIDPKSLCRITFNELTEKAIKTAVKEPRSIDIEKVDAYQARRVLDRLVGYCISPVLWRKVKKGLSAGRVQSVAVRMICDREDEIDAFESKEFWTISAVLGKNTEVKSKAKDFSAKFYGTKNKKINIDTEQQAQEITQAVSKETFTVDTIKNSEKKKSPLPPFITSTLQQDASRKLGFAASKTMSVVQTLYEGVNLGKSGATGLVTYIRTDSMRISDEAAQSAMEYIEHTYGNNFLPPKRRIFKNKNAAQDAHEAIRPTHIDLKPDDIKDSLTNDQYKLYKLIYERFIASQMADCVYDVCAVDIQAGEYVFKATGTVVKFPGYTKVYEEVNDKKEKEAGENGKLPQLEEHEELKTIEILPKQHFTQPPSRYNEASLIKALEEHGIGRPSTYAPTITVVQTRGYVGKEKKMLYPTALGRIVNDLMKSSFPDIVDVTFTANVEENLDRVAEGDIYWVKVIRDFYTDFDKEVKVALEELEHVKIPDPVSDVPCDKCGRMMVIKTGKFGQFLACPGYPECKNTKPIIEETGVDCPKCGKKLIYRKSKAGKKYITCSGYPECKFMSWNLPTGKDCPQCGEHLEYVIGKTGRFVACSNKDCQYKIGLKEYKKSE